MKKYLTIITVFISLSGFAQVFNIPESEKVTIDMGLSAGVGPSRFGTMTQYGIYTFAGKIYKGGFLSTTANKKDFGSFDFKYGYALQTQYLENAKFIPSLGVGVMAVTEKDISFAFFDMLASLTVYYKIYESLSCGIYIDSHFFSTKYTFGGALVTIYIQ